MIWTGLAMSFGFTAAFPLTVRLLGGHQTARSLHFLITILLVLFLVVHVFMIVLAGFRARMSAMITGRATPSRIELMSEISRRKLITTGLAVAAVHPVWVWLPRWRNVTGLSRQTLAGCMDRAKP